MNNNSHVFICTLGPVQDFIFTARTSKDLWFGSMMLSELSKAAARSISDQSHCLIFPAPKVKQDLDVDTTLSVANKIVAIIKDDPLAVADEVAQAIQNRQDLFFQNILKSTKDKGINLNLAREQIIDLVEFYWASAPLTDHSSYNKARAQAEAILAARKNTRNFRQAIGRNGTPKSSLDGFRESVLPDNSNSIDEDKYYNTFHAEPGEALSGIDLLKRWGESKANFPSVTDMAALPFLRMLGERADPIRQRIETLLREYTNRTETFGTFFYVERLVQLISEKTKRREFSRRFAEIFKEEQVQSPSPYYALLLVDGDNMGKTIDMQDEEEKHRAFSQQLSKFAKEASRLIRNEKGAPVFVGGDDILAYLPLHLALQCLSNLNTLFTKYLEDFSFPINSEPRFPTLSGALVIAHHLTPLSDVLDMARSAEKKAKDITGKNGLVIVWYQRGGMERTASAKMGDLLNRMAILIDYRRQKLISTSTAYELYQLHQQLNDVELPKAALQGEAIRIIQRKREVGGSQKILDKVRKQFETWFILLSTDESDKNKLTLAELAQEMIIAGEFASAYDLAGIPNLFSKEEV